MIQTLLSTAIILSSQTEIGALFEKCFNQVNPVQYWILLIAVHLTFNSAIFHPYEFSKMHSKNYFQFAIFFKFFVRFYFNSKLFNVNNPSNSCFTMWTEWGKNQTQNCIILIEFILMKSAYPVDEYDHIHWGKISHTLWMCHV